MVINVRLQRKKGAFTVFNAVIVSILCGESAPFQPKTE